jgi:hypothetical protein
VSVDAYCRWLARFFFVEGYDAITEAGALVLLTFAHDREMVAGAGFSRRGGFP